MAKVTKSETVPERMQSKFEEITQLTDNFCSKYLNDEYAQMCRYLTAAFCRKRPSPLGKGKANPWACGIVHAPGMVNFLFDSFEDAIPLSEGCWRNAEEVSHQDPLINQGRFQDAECLPATGGGGHRGRGDRNSAPFPQPLH